MARIKEYPSITLFDETNDALAIEQTDGANNRLRKVSPAQLKQYMEAGNFTVTGEIEDGHGNILKNMATRINNNSFGSAVEITSYSSSSNRFICPSDGYVKFLVNGGGSGWVYINGQILLSSAGSGSNHAVAQSVYVKKGMTVYITGASSSALYYFPIV